VIGHQTECTQEHHAFDRSSGQTDLECLICGLRNTDIRGRNEVSVQRSQLTIIANAGHVVPCTSFVTSELVHSLGQGPFRFAELDHARLEVVKWSFHEAGLFFVVS